MLVKDKKTRDRVRLYFKNNNVVTKPTLHQVHRMPAFYSQKTLSVSVSISEKGINLPNSLNLTKSNIKYIYQTFAKAKIVEIYDVYRQIIFFIY